MDAAAPCEVLANLRRNWPTADVRRFRWEVPEDQQTLSQDDDQDRFSTPYLTLQRRFGGRKGWLHVGYNC